MLKFLISIVLASATLTALPAAAEAQANRWDNPRGADRYFSQEINQLDRKIDRAARNRVISNREAVALRRDANALDRTFDQFRRNGLNQRETAQLSQRLDRIQVRIQSERRHRDGRRG